MAETAPPVDRLLLETRDVEVGHDLLRQLYADHTPRLSGDSADYRFRYAVNSLGRLGVDHMEHSLVLHADLEPYELLLAVTIEAGRLTVSSDGATEQVGPGEVLLVDPLRPVSVAQDDLRLIPVRLDLDATRAVAEEITGVPAGRVRFDMARPLSPAHARLWQSTVDHVARDVLADDDVARQPLVCTEAFRLLATTLLTTFPNSALETLSDRPAPRTFAAEPAVLRRAVEFVDANAHRDIGVAEIANAARIGVRGLQHLFRRHRDRTPLGYLRQVRMELAHRDLLAADPTRGDTVGAVAARWGFAHPGRFAVEYRRIWGRSPSETLRE
jgi:AraC-like DNA-binding protein